MKGYPPTTHLETVHDGAESAMFKQLFHKWTVQDQAVGLGKAHSVGKIGKDDLVSRWDDDCFLLLPNVLRGQNINKALCSLSS